MPGLEDRVTQLEATTAKLCNCVKQIHRVLQEEEKIFREKGQYIEADRCEHCHGIIDNF